MTPFIASAHYPHWGEVLTLIQDAFAYMEQRLGHPAKSAELSIEDLIRSTSEGPVIIVEDRDKPVACLFRRPSRDVGGALYIGRLAVSQSHRGRGLARGLIDAAARHATEHGFDALTLDTGKVLTELHARFKRLGFRLTEPLEEAGEVVTMVRRIA